MKKLISLGLVLLVVLSLLPAMPAAAAAETSGSGYYGSQLATPEARSIYNALATMRDSGYMKNGIYTVDLVADGYLQNKNYVKDTLMADFIAARDAFMLDNAALFYVDFDKLSLSMSQSGNNYSITLGVGRDTTYFRQGFEANTVGAMIRAFEAKVDAIASTALKEETMSARVRAAFNGVIAATDYALEKDAAPANVDYVRTPYGALVRGQAVCEGYARALKAVLDKMDIENVLVQGTFADDGYSGLHMWNYIRMDNGRWYLLDATMEDGLRESTHVATTDDFFLKTATDSVVACYLPDGTVSLSANSYTFRYPDLGSTKYEDLTNAFTAEQLDESSDSNSSYKKVSYKGKGIRAAKATGKYILASHDAETWYYYENFVKAMVAAAGSDSDPEALTSDQEGYFTDIFGMAYFAVTEKAPPSDFSDYKYYHGEEFIKDMSQVGVAIEYSKAPPYVIEKTPADSRVEAGKTYAVTLKYSEPLQLANAGSEAGIKLTSPNDIGSVSDFKWETGSDTVTFKLTTANSYGYNTVYYIDLVNLVNLGGTAPSGTSFYVLNTPVFSCPKVSTSINNIHSNIPALITDSNLAENEWKDENGNSIANYASNRLALVASPIPETSEVEGQVSQETMVDEIEKTLGNNTVKAAQTFDISLTLCSGQVDYITGKRVKVYVPFPEGYSYESLGTTTFKAYHFKDDGTAEEIDCVVTESGIIMMCNAFSPFAVIATDKVEAATKKVMLYSDGNGSYLDSQGNTLELVEVPNGQSVSITVTAKEGYAVESILVNGKSVSLSGKNVRTVGRQTTVTLTASALLDSGNVVEATFSLPEVKAGGTDLVVGTSVPAGVTLTAPNGGWKENVNNTFTVASQTPCVVLVSENDGRTYTRLNAERVTGAYAFTATVTTNTTITVLPAGDINGDGALTNADITTLNAIYLGKRSTDSLSKLLVDINGDGKVSNADITRLNAAYLNKRPLDWNP